jgi:demethylmenaquinone methyltransferase/2-methoxy-6-polyprenyl-1,4-benzoquinol methylase
MKRRTPGLQAKWAYIVQTLQEIIPSYEKASSRISLHVDRKIRPEAVDFAVRPGSLVLDLGSGPGTMSRLVVGRGGSPVLLDASRAMLKAASARPQSAFENRVQGVFEYLPFRPDCFDAVVSGFALRDSADLARAVSQVRFVLKPDGRFSFCDLGKPSGALKSLAVACYMRVAPGLIGLLTTGRQGLRYASLFDTYILTLNNPQLRDLMRSSFRNVRLKESQLGGSIVCECVR